MGLKILRMLLIGYLVLNLDNNAHAQCPGGSAPQQIVHPITTSPDALVQNFTYPKFDPSLGTLTGVRIDLTTSGFTMLQLVNGDGFPNNFTDMEFRRRDRLSIPGMGVSVFNDVTKTFPDMELGASDSPTPFPPYSINGGGQNEWWGDAFIPDNVAYTQNVPAASLANYIGDTGTVTLQYSIIAQFSALGVGSHYTMNVVTLATNISMDLTYTYCPHTVLSGNAIEFQVSKKSDGSNALLTWTKEKEEQGILYTPEVSDIGNSFSALGNMQSQKPANDATVVRYEFNYDIPASSNGKLYFRVRQVHADGDVTYSEVKTVQTSRLNDATVSLYPNPAEHAVTLQFKTPQKQPLQALVINSAGQTVENARIVLNGGQVYTLNFTRKHPTGVYFIKIVDPANIHKQVIRLLIK